MACNGCLEEGGMASHSVGHTPSHTCGMKWKYALVPRPGHYGNGKVRIISRHKTEGDAFNALKKYDGGWIVYWRKSERFFWADMPPEPVKMRNGGVGGIGGRSE